MKHLRKYEGFFTNFSKKFTPPLVSDIIDSEDFKKKFDTFHQKEIQPTNPNIFFIDEGRPYHENNLFKSIICNQKIIVISQNDVNQHGRLYPYDVFYLESFQDFYLAKKVSINRLLSEESISLIIDYWDDYIFNELNNDYTIEIELNGRKIKNNDSGLLFDIYLKPKDLYKVNDKGPNISEELISQTINIIKQDTGLDSKSKILPRNVLFLGNYKDFS